MERGFKIRGKKPIESTPIGLDRVRAGWVHELFGYNTSGCGLGRQSGGGSYCPSFEHAGVGCCITTSFDRGGGCGYLSVRGGYLCEHKWLDTLYYYLGFSSFSIGSEQSVRTLWTPVLQVPDARVGKGDLLWFTILTLMIQR